MTEFRIPNAEHQQREFDEFRFAEARALLWQMRTGKTKACIDLACDLYKRGKIDRVLVLAPNNVHIGWVVDQIPKHVWLSIDWEARYWSSKDSKKKGWKEQLNQQVIAPSNKLVFLTVNSEAARYDVPKKLMERFIGNAKKGVLFIGDESQDFKNPRSARGLLARKIAECCKYKRILTGSGFDNSPLNAWGQFEILQRGALGYKTYGAFEAEYAIKGLRKMGGRQFQVVEGFRNLEKLREDIARWSSVVTREEVKGLPDLDYSTQYFELSAEQQDIYSKLTKKLIMQEPKHGFQISKVFEGGVLKMKLLQITSGFLIDEYGETTWFKENPRLDLLRPIVEDHAERSAKLIVWCRFHNDIEAVSGLFTELKVPYVQFYGGVSASQRQDNLLRFQTDSDCLGFIGSPKAGGRGLNMSVAETIVWYSRDYDLEYKRQADERATAIGGSNVGIIDLAALQTVDISIIEALQEKLSISDMIDRQGLQAFLEGQMLEYEKAFEL